jgi:hypothetical protein
MVIVAIRGIALGLVLQTTLTTALTGLKPVQLPREFATERVQQRVPVLWHNNSWHNCSEPVHFIPASGSQ